MVRFSRMVSWSFLTSHARILLCIAHYPGVCTYSSPARILRTARPQLPLAAGTIRRIHRRGDERRPAPAPAARAPGNPAPLTPPAPATIEGRIGADRGEHAEPHRPRPWSAGDIGRLRHDRVTAAASHAGVLRRRRSLLFPPVPCMTDLAAQWPSGLPGTGPASRARRRFVGATECPFACGSHSHARRPGLA